MFSGGALERMSIFALGIMPYISAAIVMQLLTAVVPSLEALKDGEAGRVKLLNIRVMERYSSQLSSIGVAMGLASQGVAFASDFHFRLSPS